MTTTKKTRNCIEPWRSVQFDAIGTVTPCCSGTIKGNFGNINTDYFDAVLKGQPVNLFANAGYQQLRKGLLTGELSNSCVSCRSVHDDDITIEELKQRVINHLESQGIKTAGSDLTKEYAFTECGGNITNKCNFSCIYCAHSGENGHSGYYRADMERDRFIELIGVLCAKGLNIFNFCGIGELTIYPDWQELCKIIMSRHPQLKLRLISNFGKYLNDFELDTLLRFDLIHVSCDTLDEGTYAWLRKGGKLPVLLNNIHRLRKRFTGDYGHNPKLALNITVTDAIIDKLETLFRFAAKNSVFVHLSTLFEMQGSLASRTHSVRKITDMPISKIPFIREILYDLPRRMKSENPLTNIWEYKFLYKRIMHKADTVTYNRFIPSTGEVLYDSFYKIHTKNKDAYLRKFWLSFDESVKGIFINASGSVKITLPPAVMKIAYRAVWCRHRIDGNVDILPGPADEAVISKELTISAGNCGEKYNNMLFEVLSYNDTDTTKEIKSLLVPFPPDSVNFPVMVQEAFLMDEEENVLSRLVVSQEPIVIWCAGLKTLQMLSNTCLGKANIKMIIDGNHSKKGQLFCGRIIYSPDDLGKFSGIIVVIHSSCPEQVAFQIRRMGINNEILML